MDQRKSFKGEHCIHNNFSCTSLATTQWNNNTLLLCCWCKVEKIMRKPSAPFANISQLHRKIIALKNSLPPKLWTSETKQKIMLTNSNNKNHSSNLFLGSVLLVKLWICYHLDLHSSLHGTYASILQMWETNELHTANYAHTTLESSAML